jgi:DNA invertase Pin-like site-specific DNA recombinase
MRAVIYAHVSTASPGRAGLRNAKAKGKRIGRPRVVADAAQIASLRAPGLSWRSITQQLSLSAGTAKRAVMESISSGIMHRAKSGHASSE